MVNADLSHVMVEIIGQEGHHYVSLFNQRVKVIWIVSANIDESRLYSAEVVGSLR